MIHHRKQEVKLESGITNRKKERRKQRFPIFLLGVFGPLALGIFVTGLLYLQTPGEHDTHRLVPGALVGSTKNGQLMNNGGGGSEQMTNARESAKLVQKSGTTKQTPNYHVVFSTSCTAQMHWESYVLFYHAFKVKQPGNVTRLLSGCSDSEATEQQLFYETHIQTLSPNFHVHMTPDFSHIQHHQHEDRKEKYKYMNKPFSLRHWLEHSLGYTIDEDGSIPMNNKYDDNIVFLIDPDMILLQPLTHDFSDPKYDNVIWIESAKELSKSPDSKIVRRGHPFSQQDGYLTSNWLDLNISEITLDSASHALSISKRDGPVHWNSGPPYILTAHDAYRVAHLWTEYAPRVHKQFPKLFAEMYGYIFATAHLKMPHTFIKSLVVSTTTAHNREGWLLVDQIAGDVCPFPADAEVLSALKGGLFGLHYCKRYILGRKAFWSKYRLRKDILNCRAPLLEVPDPTIQSQRESMGPPPIRAIQAKGNWTQDINSHVSPAVAKREAFMLCGLITKTNEALEFYKRRACPTGTGNYSKVYTVHTDPG